MTERVTIETTESGPSLEAEAAAQEAAAAEAAKAAEASELEGEKTRPENVPEKFWNAETGEVNTEALLASYAELEKARSNGENTEEQEAEAQGAAEEAAEAAGLDMDGLRSEYAEKGELSEESIAKLEAVGISKDMVDNYIAGQEAQAAAAKSALLEPVGGEEAYQEMISWAADNLSDGDIDAFNAALESGDMNQTKMAVENLNTKYRAANGNEPARELNGKPGAGQGSVYESTADLMKDMQNPEYHTNPAFRAKVEAKLGRSNIL